VNGDELTAPLRRRPRRPVQWHGRGLFCGKPVRLSVHPGTPGAGWLWAVGNAAAVPLGPAHLSPQPRRSSLHNEQQNLRAQLPEHILAALLLLDVDDCTIRFHDGEAPVLDGSALPFLRGLLAAGISGPRRPAEIQVEVTYNGLQACWLGSTRAARARTFINLEEAREFGGIAGVPGARPGCALVLGGQNASRYGGRPRLQSEPTWHKLLDLLGDLGPYRARGRITGALQAVQPSHATNPALIEQALSEGRISYVV